MSVHLRSQDGEQIRLGGGHWAVYLHVAQAFGWRPQGTLPPPQWPQGQAWAGAYDSSDGQMVSEADARALAETLNGAIRSPQIGDALFDVIEGIESLVQADGTRIPEPMRMHPNDFSSEFSPVVLFLYKGSFFIE